MKSFFGLFLIIIILNSIITTLPMDYCYKSGISEQECGVLEAQAIICGCMTTISTCVFLLFFKNSKNWKAPTRNGLHDQNVEILRQSAKRQMKNHRACNQKNFRFN